MTDFISSRTKCCVYGISLRYNFAEMGVHSLPFLVKCIDIIHPHAEDEKVPIASLLGHLNVCSVHGTNGQSAVQHELHVSSARGLSTSCGDLL